MHLLAIIDILENHRTHFVQEKEKMNDETHEGIVVSLKMFNLLKQSHKNKGLVHAKFDLFALILTDPKIIIFLVLLSQSTKNSWISKH